MDGTVCMYSPLQDRSRVSCLAPTQSRRVATGMLYASGAEKPTLANPIVSTCCKPDSSLFLWMAPTPFDVNTRPVSLCTRFFRTSRGFTCFALLQLTV